jgi:hypothetical protein
VWVYSRVRAEMRMNVLLSHYARVVLWFLGSCFFSPGAAESSSARTLGSNHRPRLAKGFCYILLDIDVLRDGILPDLSSQCHDFDPMVLEFSSLNTG